MAKNEHTRTAIEISRVFKALAWGALGYIVVVIIAGIGASLMTPYAKSIAIVEHQPPGGLNAYAIGDETVTRILKDLDLPKRWEASEDEAKTGLLQSLHFEATEDGNTTVVCRHIMIEEAKDIVEAWCDLSPNFKTSPTPELIGSFPPLFAQLEEKQYDLDIAQTKWDLLTNGEDTSAKHPEIKTELIQLLKEVRELQEKVKQADVSNHLGQTVLKKPERSKTLHTRYPVQTVLDIGKYLGYAVFALIVAIKIIRQKEVSEGDITAAKDLQTDRKFDF